MNALGRFPGSAATAATPAPGTRRKDRGASAISRDEGLGSGSRTTPGSAQEEVAEGEPSRHDAEDVEDRRGLRASEANPLQ